VVDNHGNLLFNSDEARKSVNTNDQSERQEFLGPMKVPLSSIPVNTSKIFNELYDMP
jgi:hypothetical protein